MCCRSGGDRSPVVATLNGHDIHREEFEHFLELKMGEFSAGETSASLRSQILDEYLQRRLVLDEAARQGLSVGNDEIDQTTKDNPDMKSSITSAATRDELGRDLLVEKYYRQIALRDVRVSPEEIQQYIDKNQSRLTERPGFLVREIRVQTREEADRLHRELTEGRHDFASIARLHSDAPNAEKSGLSRYEEGQLPDVLEKAVRPLRPGDVSPVVESNYGFHIFKLEQRIQPHGLEDRRSKLDDRRAQLRDELISRKNQQAVDTQLERLISGADIKIHDSALGFTYEGRLRHN
jgi:parvulin-like peptidyl-prolyl isomerase